MWVASGAVVGPWSSAAWVLEPHPRPRDVGTSFVPLVWAPLRRHEQTNPSSLGQLGPLFGTLKREAVLSVLVSRKFLQSKCKLYQARQAAVLKFLQY